MAEYIPMERTMGELPEFPDQVKTYDLSVHGGIPAEAKEVFVYVFVTTHAGEGEFQRGYYEMSTSLLPGGKPYQYKQYMNVATGKGVTAVNSSNMWFPVANGQLTIKLIHPGDSEKSIAAKIRGSNWSEVFVIGYRR